MWRKYNGKAAICMGILAACMAGPLAGCGSERDAALEEMPDRIAAESDQQEASSVMEEPGSPETEQTDSDEEEAQESLESMKPDAAAAKEDGTEYDFGPVSYDLTNLPPMENEMYAEWEGKIYYRQYSDEDMDDAGLWAAFLDTPYTEKELMCMEPDGSVTQVGVDDGIDGLYIVNGRIYSQKCMQGKGSRVYSCALDGSDVKEYDPYTVLDVRGDKIICAAEENAITWIDARDGQEHTLIPENDLYFGAEYLDATEEEVFLYRLTENRSESYAPYDLTLYSVDYQGNVMDLATVTLQEYIDCMSEEFMQTVVVSPLFIRFFQVLGDDLYFSVGTTNGTAHVYSGGMIYCVKKDGSGCKRLVTSWAERFYLYDDGANRSLYCRVIDEETGRAEDGMRQIILQGEGVTGVVPRDADLTLYDRPCEYVSDGVDSILFYPDTSGVCYVLLTEKESVELGIRTHVDGHTVQQVRDIEYLSGRLFFTVTDLIYSEEYSIGWRDGYERGKSVCYCKDLESGEIRALYEY